MSRTASRADIRAAYYARLQEIHPDVSGSDTTAAAVQLNLAYTRLIGVRCCICNGLPQEPARFGAKAELAALVPSLSALTTARPFVQDT